MRTGIKAHPLWIVWLNMRRRCYYVFHPDYKNYGARGIDYDRNWNSFRNFLYDMEAGYKPGLTLDRIDNNGNYSKSNCQWVTSKENSRHKRDTILTMEKAEEIRRLKKAGRRTGSLAAEFRVSAPTICDVVNRRSWS